MTFAQPDVSISVLPFGNRCPSRVEISPSKSGGGDIVIGNMKCERTQPFNFRAAREVRRAPSETPIGAIQPAI
ncbi:MAG: hypothetical protein ACI8TQ_002894 [Planctomycetota bacterium]|jgi:hypothetical protein